LQKIGHYKKECPELAKERGRSGFNRNSRGRKAYIAWEEDEVTSNTSDTENKDEDNFFIKTVFSKLFKIPSPCEIHF